jgi:hypothetical protein
VDGLRVAGEPLHARSPKDAANLNPPSGTGGAGIPRRGKVRDVGSAAVDASKFSSAIRRWFRSLLENPSIFCVDTRITPSCLWVSVCRSPFLKNSPLDHADEVAVRV